MDNKTTSRAVATCSLVVSWSRGLKKGALENFSEPKKNNKKAIHSQGLMKNVSALGVQNVTSQLLIKPRAKIPSV